MIGLRGALLTATRGTATVASRFLEYAPVGSAIPRQRNGAVVATESGTTTSYAIANVQERARRPHVRYEPPVASREWIGAAQERAPRRSLATILTR